MTGVVKVLDCREASLLRFLFSACSRFSIFYVINFTPLSLYVEVNEGDDPVARVLQESDKLRDDDLYKFLADLKRPGSVLKRLKSIPGGPCFNVPLGAGCTPRGFARAVLEHPGFHDCPSRREVLS